MCHDCNIYLASSLRDPSKFSIRAEGIKDVVMQDLRNLKSDDKAMQIPPCVDEIMLLGIYIIIIYIYYNI